MWQDAVRSPSIHKEMPVGNLIQHVNQLPAPGRIAATVVSSPWRRNGGHRHHHIVGLLAVVGGEEVGPDAQRLLVRHVRLREKDAELPWQLLEKQAVEEGVVLLANGTETQHLRQQLRRLLGRYWREIEQLLHPLDVGQLVGDQKTTAQLRVGVRRKRVHLHQVGDEAHCRLQQGVKTVEEPARLVGDVAQPERPLSAGKPGPRIRSPEWR
jgi:hypothetical protein